MHAILLTVGTDGDIVPFVGLGSRLRARGHRVTLAANEHFRDVALEQGLEFHSLVFDPEYRELLANPDIWHPTRSAFLGIQWGKKLLERQYELIAQLATEPDSVLIANPGILSARIAHETLGRPLVSIVLQPWLIHSALSLPTMPGRFHLPRWTPRPVVAAYLSGMNALGDVLIGRDVNRLRAGLGLPRMRRIFRWWLSPQRVIGLFPDWYGMPQSDWPAQVRLAGFPMFDGRSPAPLDPVLLAFCRESDPPIACTLGTGMMHAAAFFREAAEACRMLGRRGIFLTQFAEQLPTPLPAHVRHCSYAPFLELFPLCAAVVHHGGVGTAAKALASGTPQLILPMAFDQMDNARRLREMGVGGWLKPGRRQADDLAGALARLLEPAVHAHCKAAAERCRGQREAFETAAEWVEELAGGSVPAPCTA
jgi:UDP:flavonoid glycosyltransferase YjiC (YdhE family)